MSYVGICLVFFATVSVVGLTAVFTLTFFICKIIKEDEERLDEVRKLIEMIE